MTCEHHSKKEIEEKKNASITSKWCDKKRQIRILSVNEVFRREKSSSINYVVSSLYTKYPRF